MAVPPKDSIVEVEHDDNKKQDAVQESNVDPLTQRALLRKLDYRMMPVFFVLYFLNHCKRQSLCSRFEHTDRFLSRGSKWTTSSQTQWNFATPRPPRHPVQHLHIDPLRRIPYRWHPLEHDPDTSPAVFIHGRVHVRLGNRVRIYGHGGQLHPPPCSEIPPWMVRGSILPGCHLPSEPILHKERSEQWSPPSST